MRTALERLKAVDVPIASIIDVGVQVGTPPLMQAFPTLLHLLMEPIDAYYPQIEKNYAAIPHKIEAVAVSDTDGEVHLRTEKKTRGNEISHSYIESASQADTLTVRSVKLDTHLAHAGWPKPYLLKIDVEGADVPAAILRGAAQTLRDCSVVVIEMTVDRFMERAALIHTAGFDLWDIVDLCYYDNTLWQVDAIFLRRDLKANDPRLRPMSVKPFNSDLWVTPE